MDAHTSAIPADAARVSTRHTLKLSVVHLKYAAQIVAYAPPVEYHACKLVRLCAKTKAEAYAIAAGSLAPTTTRTTLSASRRQPSSTNS
jgi:hypothetical protein